MSERKLGIKQQILKAYDVSEYIKSYVFLIMIIPIAGIAVVCLYYGSIFAMTGSLASILAVVLLPIGIMFGITLIFGAIPVYFISRRSEKERKEISIGDQDSISKNNNHT